MAERRTFAVWMKMTVLTRCEVEARSEAEARRKADVLNFTHQGPLREVVDWEVDEIEDLADAGRIDLGAERRAPEESGGESEPESAR